VKKTEHAKYALNLKYTKRQKHVRHCQLLLLEEELADFNNLW